MLVAFNLNKIRVFATESNKGDSFFCCDPNCTKPELILCKGQIVSAYFRHKQKDFICDYHNESVEHEFAKLYLINILSLNSDQIEYRGIDGIRPDIFKDPFGIEFQNSKITIENFQSRNLIYLQNNKIPLWFFYYSYDKTIDKTLMGEQRFSEVQLCYSKDKIPCYSITPEKKLIIFFINCSSVYRSNDYSGYTYKLKKLKEIEKIDSFEINTINDFNKIIQYINSRWILCIKCQKPFLITKEESFKDQCLCCYRKTKTINENRVVEILLMQGQICVYSTKKKIEELKITLKQCLLDKGNDFGYHITEYKKINWNNFPRFQGLDEIIKNPTNWSILIKW
jgi:hypothetical protein